MKRLLLFLVFLIPCCLGSCYIGFKFGGRVGQHRATTVRAVYVTCTLDSLRQLRSGDIVGATTNLEHVCFVDALEVLSDSGWKPPSRDRVFVPFIREYRQAYRTNTAVWTPEERRLEQLLSGRK
jgi:hypothetical protein